MKIPEFVDTIKTIKPSIDFINVYYSSTVKKGNYDSYSVVPLEVEVNRPGCVSGHCKISFDELVNLFDGKIPYITVYDSPYRTSRIYDNGHTVLQISPYKYTSKAGNPYCKHSTRCTRDVRLDELENEVAPKIKKMKAAYRKKCSASDDAYSEVPLLS